MICLGRADQVKKLNHCIKHKFKATAAATVRLDHLKRSDFDKRGLH